MTPPRCLLVCFNRLVPAQQGNARRIHQLLQFYRGQGFEIDLLYHDEEGFDVGLCDALRPLFGRVTVLASGASKRIRPGHVCRVDDWYDGRIDRACRELQVLRGYTVVHANYVWYSPLFEQFGARVLKVLDTHDLFARRGDKYLAAALSPQWFSTTEAEEDHALRRADLVLAIQRHEAQAFTARGHRHILYLPFAEPPRRGFGRDPGETRPPRFGYLGSGNDWNILSFNDLLRQLAARRVPWSPPILVAGGVSRHVVDGPGVVRLGHVHSLDGFYDAIDVALNPMVGGTGLKIKTVEPLAFGCPVLASRAGVEGLGHLWRLPVYDDNAALADDLIERFAPARAGPALGELRRQAAATRDAFDAECSAQGARFAQCLCRHLGASATS